MRPARHGAAVALALLAALPAAANASVAELVPKPPYPESQPSDYYMARYIGDWHQDTGWEDNHLKISEDLGGVTFNDPGAPVDPRLGCEQVNAHTAHCGDSGEHQVLDLEVDLNWGDDTLDVPHGRVSSLTASAGPGDDVLKGGGESDDFDGGGGHDRLLGRAGRDTLNDGDRDGVFYERGPNTDVLDGGPDEDTLSYEGRKRRVTVDLESGAAGEKGERDDVRSFESATGGAGDDRLIGDDGPNKLVGGRGDDTLTGRGGDGDRSRGPLGDLLYGGSGRDKLAGGAGPDALFPGSGRDSLSCGGGEDIVYEPAAGEVIGHCERVSFFRDDTDGGLTFETDPHAKAVTRRRVVFAVDCPRDYDSELERCSGDVVLREAFGRHRLLGRAHFEGGSVDLDPTPIRLTRLGRKLVRRRHGVVATVRLGGDYPMRRVAWTVRIRR